VFVNLKALIQYTSCELGKGIGTSKRLFRGFFSCAMGVVFDRLDCSVLLAVLWDVVIVWKA